MILVTAATGTARLSRLRLPDEAARVEGEAHRTQRPATDVAPGVLDLDVVSWAEIELVMRTADAMREVLGRPIAKVPALRGRNVTILFYEASIIIGRILEIHAG